ncbi:MAG: 16S rRNA (cytidine(1402)-2'-O)-methyltransferase [Victivallaceae bacterium]|nr:16S rRNA (cytidine(1402)-2'-O)-methyltransferase [Victivallaceae bacterium]
MEEIPEKLHGLFLVATPIGNLEDITLRALRVLRSVDLIAAEDTRHTRQLLSHFDIHVPLESCHSFNEHQKVGKLVEKLRAGFSVALVSDAGTPSLADPGYLLVNEALEAGIEPVVIPGVSALTFSVTASGLPVDHFQFLAFAPVKPGKRAKFFEKIRDYDGTTFFFESPFRVGKTLKALCETAGKNRRGAIIREATKIHEEILRGTLEELAARRDDWRGEFVIGVGPAGNTPPDDDGR